MLNYRCLLLNLLLNLSLSSYAYLTLANPSSNNPSVGINSPSNNEFYYLGWIPLEFMTLEEKKSSPCYCKGSYKSLYPKNKNKQHMIAKANKIQATKKSGIINLDEDVHIEYKNFIIDGDSAISNKAAKQVKIKNNVYIQGNGFISHGDRVIIDTQQENVDLYDTTFIDLTASLRIKAKRVNIQAGVFTIYDGYFSLCDPQDNSWEIGGKKIKIDQTQNEIEVYHSLLFIYDLPVFYFPYLTFPLQGRKTGLLLPTISSNGFKLPVYWNLAPNYDATTTLTKINNYGTIIDTQLRLLTQHTENQIDYATLINSQNELYSPWKQWKSTIKHKGDFRSKIGDFYHGWLTEIAYSRASDSKFYNLYNNNLSLTSAIIYNNYNAAYADANLSFKISFNDYQLLIAQNTVNTSVPYKKLPEIIFNYSSALESQDNSLDLTTSSKNKFFYNLKTISTAFTKDFIALNRDNKIVDRNPYFTADRLSAILTSGWQIKYANLSFTPAVSWYHNHYNLGKMLGDTQQTNNVMLESKNIINVPITTLNASMTFEVRNESFTTQIKPQLFYVYAPYVKQRAVPLFDTWPQLISYPSLFSPNHFSGHDRINDANRLSVAIQINLSPNGSNTGVAKSVEPLLQLAIGKMFFMQDRKVRLDSVDPFLYIRTSSPYIGKLKYNITPQWRVSSHLVWDNVYGIENSNTTNLSYKYDTRNVYDISYVNAKRNNIQYAHFSVIQKLSQHWSFLGAYKQDILNNKLLKLLVGLEYTTCCWRAQIISYNVNKNFYPVITGPNIAAIEERPLDKVVALQIIFKRLGGFSYNYAPDSQFNIDSEAVLRSNILGYTEHQKNYNK